MVDTKISALPAAGAAAGANEFAINEAGTSKKVTGSQITALVLTTPVNVAGDVLATGTVRAGTGGATGVAQLVNGGAGGAGYLAIVKPDTNRVGYIGDSQTNLKIVVEIGVLEVQGVISHYGAYGKYDPGVSVSVPTGNYMQMAKNLTMTSTRRLTLSGTSRLRIS